MNMWLVHQSIIDDGVHLQNPVADLGWVYLRSLLAGYLIFWLCNRLEKLFTKNRIRYI